MKRILLFVSMMWLSCSAFAQTGTIEGKIDDGDSNEGLPGANILVKGTSSGTITDIDGKFSITNLKAGSYTLEISYIGYEIREINATVTEGQTTDIGTLELAQATVGLKEVEIIASVAIDRRTPVAFSSIDGKKIESKIGNQEFPEILKSTPSIYVTKQGGGFGDARINVRGFTQRDVAVMINGVPVNDMENGWVYWSNWAGLSDVTSKIQIQRGLGASKLAVPSIGGSINIITDAASMKKGIQFSSTVGNDRYQKYGLVYSTGLSKSGWAATFQGTHTEGDGYVDGTKFNAWSYFISISKQINKSHSIALTGLGAPQWHHQRDYAPGYLDYQEYGHKYNSDWGYLNGKEYTWRRNFYHKPKIFANWYWTISEKTELATSAYISYGRGGGTGPRGGINGMAEYQLPKVNGVYWFDDIVAWNRGENITGYYRDVVNESGETVKLTTRPLWDDLFDNRKGFYEGKNVATESGTPSGYYTSSGKSISRASSYGMIRRASMNAHNWSGFLSNLTHKLSESISMTAGIDIRKYRGIHYRRLDNLLGNDAFFTNDNINLNGEFITDERESNALVNMKNDQKLDYWNDGLVRWYGAYTQFEYSSEKLSSFISLSASNQGFKRIDYFNYYYSDALNEQAGLDENFESDWENFWGGNMKIGANYNITDQHNVFANAGFLSRQPIFDNVFPVYTNEVNNDTKNQRIIAFEGGYGFRNERISANLNLYHTIWLDRQFNRSFDAEGEEYSANFSLNQLHQGVELDMIYSPANKLNIYGTLSVGSWKYTSNPTVNLYDDDQNLVATQTIYLKNVKVGDAAQFTLNLSADYQITHGLSIDAAYQLVDNLYADYNIVEDDFFFEEGNQAWKLPSYGLVDLGATYNFKLAGKLDMSFRVNVNNLLDNIYISESDTNSLTDDESEMIPGSENGSVYNRVFYGFGRTWNAGLKVKF